MAPISIRESAQATPSAPGSQLDVAAVSPSQLDVAAPGSHPATAPAPASSGLSGLEAVGLQPVHHLSSGVIVSNAAKQQQQPRLVLSGPDAASHQAHSANLPGRVLGMLPHHRRHQLVRRLGHFRCKPLRWHDLFRHRPPRWFDPVHRHVLRGRHRSLQFQGGVLFRRRPPRRDTTNEFWAQEVPFCLWRLLEEFHHRPP